MSARNVHRRYTRRSIRHGVLAVDGGTIRKAPIGYLSTRARVEGREVRTVAIDPQRAPLVRMTSDLYATGDYSISELRDQLEESGLLGRDEDIAQAKPTAWVIGIRRLAGIILGCQESPQNGP